MMKNILLPFLRRLVQMVKLLFAFVFSFCFLLTVKTANSLNTQEYRKNKIEQQAFEAEVQANATLEEILNFADTMCFATEGSKEFRYSIIYTSIQAKLADMQIKDKISRFEVHERFNIKGRGIEVRVVIGSAYPEFRPFIFDVTP